MGFHANACSFALDDVLRDKKSKLRPRVVAVDGVLLIQLIAPIALYADCALWETCGNGFGNSTLSASFAESSSLLLQYFARREPRSGVIIDGIRRRGIDAERRGIYGVEHG